MWNSLCWHLYLQIHVWYWECAQQIFAKLSSRKSVPRRRKGWPGFLDEGMGNLCRKTTAVYRFQNHGFLYVLFPIDQPIFISIDTSIKSYDVLPLISTIKLPFFVACRVHLSGFRGDEQPKGGTVFSGGSVVLPGQMSHRCNGNILGDEYHGDTGN